MKQLNEEGLVSIRIWTFLKIITVFASDDEQIKLLDPVLIYFDLPRFVLDVNDSS